MKHACQPPPRKLGQTFCIIRIVFLLAINFTCQGVAIAAPSKRPLADYLATWQLFPSVWQEYFSSEKGSNLASLSPGAGKVLVRLLDRLQAAPPEWRQLWAAEAFPLTDETVADSLEACRSVWLEGIVTEAVQVNLSDELALVAGRSTLGLVTLTQPGGLICRVLVPELPAGMPRGVGLSQRGGAVAVLLAEGSHQKKELTSVLAVSTRLSWWPETPLGRLGMDYGLFGSVHDGQPLEAEEAEAFYSVLAACRDAPKPAVPQKNDETDLVPLIDPDAKWFGTYRGDPVSVAGTARRIIRVPVSEPRWQALLGSDYYWELFVFVPTPLVEIAGHLQESFPVVCCCLELPAGMPRGERVNEPIAISGFGFKRYRYETRRAATRSSRGQPQEAPLLLARSVRWLPAAVPIGLPAWGKWLPAIAALAVTCGLIWAFLRAGQRQESVLLPERIDIPLVPEIAAVDEALPKPPGEDGGASLISQ